MRGEEEGIVLSKGELEALIAFSHPDSADLNCVVFETEIHHVNAYSMDGYAGIMGKGDNGGFTTEAHRWRVELEFLEAAKKALGSKDYVRLEFSGDSLHEAVVLELLESDGDPVLEARATIQWPHDACLHQGELPFADWRQVFAPFANDKGVPQEQSPRYLKRFGCFEKIGAEVVTSHSGRHAKDGTTYAATGYDGTTWAVVIKPPGQKKPKTRKTKDERQRSLDDAVEGFREACDDTECTISVNGGEPVKVPKSKKRQAQEGARA